MINRLKSVMFLIFYVGSVPYDFFLNVKMFPWLKKG